MMNEAMADERAALGASFALMCRFDHIL